MSRARTALGGVGEGLVAAHLERQGFRVVARNVRFGRLEIDLIARREALLVFCEVRTRSSRNFVDPIETIDRAKCDRVRRAALGWMQSQSLSACELRFDAASVVLNDDEETLTYYESAF
ncbi:MAG TPA: YraN family protein [Polyangiaceae bacterium]|nr:YraN family protein [Polyangiaceae bacterium]